MTPEEIERSQANVRALAFSSLTGLVVALAGALAVVAARDRFFEPETLQLLVRMLVLSGFLGGSLLAIGGALVFVSGLIFARQETTKAREAIRSGGNHATADGAKG